MSWGRLTWTKQQCLALVTSLLDYFNSPLYGLPHKFLHKLQEVQNLAAHVTFRVRSTEHITRNNWKTCFSLSKPFLNLLLSIYLIISIHTHPLVHPASLLSVPSAHLTTVGLYLFCPETLERTSTKPSDYKLSFFFYITFQNPSVQKACPSL